MRHRRWWFVISVLALVGTVVIWRFNNPTGIREAVGVVVAVDGDLEAVDSFELMTAGGRVLRLVPQPGGRFDFPLPHLGTHMRSLEPVRVSYVAEEDGRLVVIRVGDG